ncbi:hypothetical protein ZEAMMB73_Zm00001d044990 [Zea mays]|uniref:Uncharacterized protein n=1 Tax=Zea mays TaxID=4577 RepID=A0A1D6NSQ7_MAIZE|nr:hypothetical protein ZEAMMB73_Zm00001d044990 [Zea mays]
MDSRWDLIVVGYGLTSCKEMLYDGRCLETSDYSTVHFNPDHHTTYHLKTIRRSLIQNPRRRIVDKFLENRRAHLTTVISD